eukprot:TRINITY_DN1363_c0_g2_i4.p2 TRINITY_DN1363_c0_g2~~TRINITY_DN1363_c0_g2_i4.p2  ORF type:complete len:427 (-),score=134.13 TRINITY_DN1363_c0_g2_i4:47-1327(-)
MQIAALDHTLFPSFHEFGVRYCAGYPTTFGWNFNGACNLDELCLLLQASIMIRRLKKDVLTELPEKRRERIFIGIVEQHSTIIKGIMHELRQVAKTVFNSEAKEDSSEARSESKRLLLELYRNSGAAKLPLVTDFIKDKLESCTEKFIVFAHHQDVIDGISNTLKSVGAGFIRIDGKTPQQQRQALVQSFQECPECRVAVLSITAAGVGLSFTAASQVIFAELFWNPGMLRQAEDRVHRIGQRLPVTIQYLLARNTVDEMIWDLVERKLDVVGHAIDGTGDVQEAEEVEGKQGRDAEEATTRFLHDILEVVDTFAVRMETWRDKKTKRKEIQAKAFKDDSGRDEGKDGGDAKKRTKRKPSKKPVPHKFGGPPIVIESPEESAASAASTADDSDELDIMLAAQQAQLQMEHFRYGNQQQQSDGGRPP